MPTIFDNEASAVDLKVYDALKDLGWKLNDTMLYQPTYALTEEQECDFPGSKSIKPDFVLEDLQQQPIAVLENKLHDPERALPRLRLKYSRIPTSLLSSTLVRDEDRRDPRICTMILDGAE